MTENRNPHPQSDLRFTDLAIVEVNPMEVLPAPGNRPVTPESVTDLMESMEAGQVVPAILYRDAEGNLRGADGNRRAMVCCIKKMMLKAIILGHEPTWKELSRLRVAANSIHKRMNPDQLGTEIEEYLEKTGESQEEAAAWYGYGAPRICKLLADKRLAPDLEHLRQNPGLSRDARRVIATMPTHELQRQLAERALKRLAEGRPVKRDTLEAWKREMLQAMNGSGKKPREVKASAPKAKITFSGSSTWQDGKEFAKRLLAACTQGEKAGRPFSSLPELLTG